MEAQNWSNLRVHYNNFNSCISILTHFSPTEVFFTLCTLPNVWTPVCKRCSIRVRNTRLLLNETRDPRTEEDATWFHFVVRVGRALCIMYAWHSSSQSATFQALLLLIRWRSCFYVDLKAIGNHLGLISMSGLFFSPTRFFKRGSSSSIHQPKNGSNRYHGWFLRTCEDWFGDKYLRGRVWKFMLDLK